MLVWPVGTDPHVCLLSNPAHSAARDCLLAWHPSLGTALPGQARRMLLASYVVGNRCDSWLSALWHGFALRQHMAGGPSHWRLCLPHAAWSLWPSPGQPCPSLAHHLSLFAAHAFTLATDSHASVAGWDRPTCVPCRQSFLVCLLWLCLAWVRRLECLRCLKMQMVYSVGLNPACGCTSATFGQPCAPRLWFCAATTRRQEAEPTLLPFSLADLITCLRQLG